MRSPMGAGESSIAFGMLALHNPNAVFVLQSAIIGARDDAPVASEAQEPGRRPGRAKS
ncbi:MAG: hypothetical protein WCD49_18005 [Candidatus Acidiferrales bacterium]